MFKQTVNRMERFLQLDMNYFLGNSALSMAGQITDALTALLLTFFLSNFTSKTTFGDYYLVISILSLISICSLPGLTTAITRSVALGFDGDYFGSLKLAFRRSLIGSGLLVITAIYFLVVNRQQLFLSLILSSVVFPFLYSFNSCWSGLLIGKKMFKHGFGFSLINSLTLLILTTLAVFFRPSTPFLVTSFLLGTAIPNVVIYFYLKKIAANNQLGPETNQYAVFITKTNIITQLSLQIDQIAMGFFLNPIAVADYRVASSLSNVLRNFEKSATNILVPKIIEHDKEKIKQKIFFFLPLILLGSLVAIAVLFILQPLIIPLLFSSRYLDVISPAQIILVSLIFTPIELISYQYFLAYKKKVAILTINTIIPIVKVAATVVSLMVWGFWGVVVSTLFVRLFNAALYFLLLKKS
jgi:O-antigen/teichoic acid export membrane protein